jgi:nucleoid-associated protein YejK
MSSKSLQNKNVIDESTQSKLEIFYNNTQETLEKGFETAFKNLNDSLITTINTAFSTFESEHERRLENNRESHERP